MVSCIITTSHTWIRLSIFFFLSLSLSFSQAHDYCTALHDSLLFYEAQRSGKLSKATNRINWRGDSALKDSTLNTKNNDNNNMNSNIIGNLAGGYYDGGDGMKFAFPLAFTTTTLSWGLIEFADAVKKCGEYENYLATIRWATDWLIKAHTNTTEFYGQVGESDTDHSFWGPPEKIPSFTTVTTSFFNTTTNETEYKEETKNLRPSFKIDDEKRGTDLACEVSAALSAASIVFQKVDARYSLTLLKHAREMHSFGYSFPRSFYHDSIPDAANFYRSYGYEDEIVWSTLWLYLATHESEFLTIAKSDFQNWKEIFTVPGNTFDWDQKAPGILVLLSIADTDPSYRVAAERWMASWKKGGEGEQEKKITYTPGGLAWVRRWGPLRYSSASSFLSLFLDSSDWGTGQINYMLGDNPNKTSYVCGFGENSPRNPRHRAAHASPNDDVNNPITNSHVLTGALVGGPGVNDEFVDSRENIGNEVSIDFNAAFTSAIAGLASQKFYGANFNSSLSLSLPSSSPTFAPTPSPSPTPTPSPPSKWIELDINSGSSIWWIAIHFQYSEQEILDVEIMDSLAVSFVPMRNNTWGFWEFYSPSSLSLPVFFRISLSNSDLGLVTLAQILPGASFETNIEF